MCIKLCICICYQAAWIVDDTDVDDSYRSDNGDTDDGMVLVHMASLGNNSEVKDYNLCLKVAEFYRSGSH